MADRYTFDEEVTLISVFEKTDAMGDTVATETRTVSFAQIVSPFMKEAYQALAVGLRPEFVAILPSWEDDYHGEWELEYKGIRYRILRAYKAKDLSCELTCTRITASVSESGTLASGVSGGVF